MKTSRFFILKGACIAGLVYITIVAIISVGQMWSSGGVNTITDVFAYAVPSLWIHVIFFPDTYVMASYFLLVDIAIYALAGVCIALLIKRRRNRKARPATLGPGEEELRIE